MEELLDAGIDVYTTLNVQHVESLNDVVAQVTGVVVRETVPDTVLEEASEVRLIDLPPDELLERLADGKVYMAERASRAVENFFRKGNLIALRELALRSTAERVDAQMRVYKTAHGIQRVWPTTERVLVCVSASPSSARLIRAARRMAASLHAPCIAAYVETPASLGMSDGATVSVSPRTCGWPNSSGRRSSRSRARARREETVRYAAARNVTKIVARQADPPSVARPVPVSFLDEIVRSSGDIDVYVISGDAAVERRPKHRAREDRDAARSRTSRALRRRSRPPSSHGSCSAGSSPTS